MFRARANVIGVRVVHAVQTTAQDDGRSTQLGAEHARELAKDIHHQRAAAVQAGTDVGISQRREHQRPQDRDPACPADAGYRLSRFLGTVDER